MGPTASGKTDLAVQLVKSLPLEIISVDSALVYKGMDVGTAKPDQSILDIAPHHLIDFLDPSQPYSAANFVNDALRVISTIQAKGRIPFLVGGTMLYFRALLQGLADMPPASPEIREAIMTAAERDGWAELHRELQRIDPVAGARIHPNDPQRIQRALEVYRLTGTPISDWQTKTTTGFQGKTVNLGLMPSDRSELHQRISARFEQMLKNGLIDEVQRLIQRGDLSPELPAMRAVGYRQVWEYLQGQLSYSEMVEKAIYATRQLAKRQMTWLRSMPNITIFDCLNKELANLVLKNLSSSHIF